MDFSEFRSDWESNAADIEADLSYNKNLGKHFLTTQLFIFKLKNIITSAEWLDEDITPWELLGYHVYNLNDRILNKIPDFSAKQHPQLDALSRGTIKEENLYNVTLNNPKTIAEEAYLKDLRAREFQVKEAYITPGEELVIVLVKPQYNTLYMTATAYSREVEANGLNFKRILFYDGSLSEVSYSVNGTPIFEKPLR
jgi:hypothetical protein